MANQTSNYQLKVGVVTDQASFKILQQSLQNIIELAKQPGNELNKDIQEAARNAQLVGKALNSSYNSKLGTMNIAKMNKELQKSNVTVNSLHTSFSKVGADGANAFNTLAAASMRANVQIKQSNKLLDSLATTMTNTVKWGITSGIWNSVTSSISGAVTYVEKLDRSLNDIRIVTNKNAEAMAEFAKQANRAAKAVGAGTTDYTDAALIYYQQGLADAEVKARAEVTLKAANVTRQSADEVSEQLTAVWNGYKVSASEAELYIDKLAAVAASTAADLEELSTGMSKVASAANSMGVDVDQLNAQLATIVSVTRQAPESVGTALKTIYARMGDLKLGGEDEFGVSLGEVTKDLASVGINVLDQTGNLRDMGDVIEEVAAKWETWNEAQRTAVAISIAGKRQYNNLVALFDNWDMYSDALDTSVNSLGTLQKQQDIYMESTDAKLQKMKTSWEQVYSTVIDTDALNTGIDTLGNLAEAFNALASAFGGGMKTIGAAVAILSSVFSNQIGHGIGNMLNNRDITKSNAATINLRDDIRETGLINTFNVEEGGARAQMLEDQAEKNRAYLEQYDNVRPALTNEQYNKVVATAKKKAEIGYNYDEALWKIEQEEEAIGLRQASFRQEKVDLTKLEDEERTLQSRIETIEKYPKPTKAQAKELKSEREQLEIIRQKKTELQKTVQEHEEINDELDKQTAELKKQKQQATKNRDQQLSNAQQELDDEIGTPEQLERNAQVQTVFNGVAGAAQLAAGAIMGVSAAFDIWSNKDLSFAEKLTQSIFSLSPAIMLVVDGFKKLNSATLANGTVSELFTKIKTKQTAATVAGAAAKKLDSKNTKENTKETLENAAADVVETGTELASKAADTAGGAGAGAVGAGANAVGGGVSSAGAGAAAAGLSVAAAAAIVLAAFAAAVIIWRKVEQKKALEELEHAQEEADKFIAESTTSQELSNKANSLASAIKNLSSEIEAQGSYTDDLKNKVYNLCTEYGNEELAVKSLAMSYGELEQAAEDAAIAQAKVTGEDAEVAQEKILKEAQETVEQAKTKSGTGYSWGQFFLDLGRATESSTMGTTTSDYFSLRENEYGLRTGITVSEEEQKLYDALNNISGINIRQQDGSAISGVSFDYEELFKEENWKQISEVLEQFPKLANEKGVKDFKGIIDKLESVAASYQEQGSVKTSSRLDQISATVKAEDISTIDDYREVKDRLVKEASEVLDEEAAETWARELLNSLNGKITIPGEISAAINKDSLDEIDNQIDAWTKDEQNFVYLHLGEIENIDDATELLTEMKDYIDISKANTGMGLANSLFSVEGKLNKDQIEELYSAGFNAVDKVAFSMMSETQQKDALLQYSFEQLEYIIAHQAEVEQDLIDTIASLKEDGADTTQKYGEMEDKLLGFAKEVRTGTTYSGDVRGNLSSFDSMVNILKANDVEKYREEYEALAEVTGMSVEDLLELIISYEELNDELSVYEGYLANVKNLTDDYAAALEMANKNVKEHKENLSTLSNSYNSLTDIVDSYNKTGKFSIDNVLTLMSLEPEYLALLQWENGQLQINEEALKNTAIAKLNDAKAAIVRKGAAELDSLAQNKVKEDSEATNEVLSEQEAQLYTTAAAWVAYAAAKHAGVADSEEGQNIIKGVEAQLAAIDNLIANITENGFGSITSKAINFIEKQWKDEFDQFWTQNKIIDKLNRTLEKLKKNREHLYGDELRESLSAENELIQQQIEASNTLLEQQKAERDLLKETLSQDFGVKFNEAGEISNYEAIVQAQTDLYNNSKGSDAAEKHFDDFTKALDKYEELSEDMLDLEEEIEDLSSEQIDNNFEIWSSHIEDLLEKQEELRDMADYNLEVSQDFRQVYQDLGLVKDNLKANLDTYAGEGGTIATMLTDIEKIGREIEVMSKGEESTMFHSMSQAQEELKKKQEELRAAALETKQIYEDLYDTYLRLIDQAIDKMDDFYEQYERINESLDYNAELVELIYGEKAYDLYSSLYNAQMTASQSQLSNLIKEKEMYEKLYAQAEEGTKDQLKYKERLWELEDQINDKVLEHIQLLKNDYANAIDQILDSLEKQMTGGSSLADMEEEWDRIKEKAEKYYDSVEGLYQIQTLSNSMTKDINNASLESQKKLQSLHDKEIAYLKNKKNLTEYDVQAAEARYQITLKEIALEEAQKAKNSMKLVRDVNGNWTYQYTADEDEVRERQQDVLDAYQNLYKLADDAYKNNIDSIIALNKKYIEEAKRIAKDSTLTEEQRVKKLEKLRDQYLEDYKLLAEENALYAKDISQAYADNLDVLNTFDGTELTSKIKNVMNDGYASWFADAQKMVALWQGAGGEGQTSIESAITSATSNMISKIGEFSSAVDNLASNVGQQFNTEEGIIGTFDDCKESVENLDKAIDNFLTEDLYNDLISFASYVSEVGTVWDGVASSTQAAIDKYNEWAALASPITKTVQIVTEYVTYGSGGGTSADINTGGGGFGGDDNSGEPEFKPATSSKPAASSTPISQTELDMYKNAANSSKPYASSHPAASSTPISQTELGLYGISNGEDNYYRAYGPNVNSSTPVSTHGNASSGSGKSSGSVTNTPGTTDRYEVQRVGTNSTNVRVKDQKTGETLNLTLEEWGKLYGTQMNTGGYTGDWGSTSGRLAILHQKELVLNQTDTTNILSAVSAIRSIAGLNSSINEAMMQGISRMMLEMSGISANANYNTEASKSVGDTIYEIHAEFPDANDVNSIREAILSLPNLASQRVSKYSTV